MIIAAISGIPDTTLRLSSAVERPLLIIAILLLGFAFAFSEGRKLRISLGVVLGVTIVATAASFALNFLGFTSGATF